MRNKIALSLLLSLGMLTNVQAGSMGSVNAYPNFGGFYGGLGTGLMTLISKDAYSVSSNPAFRPPVDGHVHFTDSAVMFDGHLGYGKMFNQTYFGGKASIYYTPLRQVLDAPFSVVTGTNSFISGNNIGTTTIKPQYNLDAVLGYQILPRLLPFVEAGLTFANVETNYHASRMIVDAGNLSSYNVALNSNKYTTGGNVGFGANYLVNKNWFLSSELVYSYLGKGTVSSTTALPIGGVETNSRTKTNQSVSLLASVSYLFPES